MDLSEDELLTAIRRVLSDHAPDVVVPIGDDAAVVRAGAGDLVLTTDVLVEGTHFDRATATAHDIGYKSVAVNVSDVAAMAASPRYALCALTLSHGVDGGWVMELFGGMREACVEFACILVGGNLARGSDVTVAVSLAGQVARGRALTRAGAKAGDVVVVTGSLGGAAAGLRLSGTAVGERPRRGWTDDELDAIRHHDRPMPRVGEAQVLARHGASAMIDVSDGLARDLVRMCDASAVGVRLELSSVPVHPAAAEGEALGGGEDYELLATMPSDAAASEAAGELADVFGVPLTTVGLIVFEGSEAVDASGVAHPLEPTGWDHFA